MKYLAFLIQTYFLFSLFGEEIFISCDKTFYEKDIFYFSKGFTIKQEEKTLSSNKARLKYPHLFLEEDVCFFYTDSVLNSDFASIDLLTKNVEFTSHVQLQKKEVSFCCEKAIITEKKDIEIFDNIQVILSDTKIFSDKMNVSFAKEKIFLTGSLKGTFGNTTFSYNGLLEYDKEKKVMQTQKSPFYLTDNRFDLTAKKAEFFLVNNKLEKIYFSGPVEIVSEDTKALSDAIVFYPDKKTYVLKSHISPVLLWQDGCLLSANEIHIKQEKGKEPEIETKGIVHFSLSDKEKSRFKHLLKK